MDVGSFRLVNGGHQRPDELRALRRLLLDHLVDDLVLRGLNLKVKCYKKFNFGMYKGGGDKK
jgi:hypothetical protein